ncbi:PAF15 factor, partial [Fregetta grallaria]|nr:PAF15 factor [Fregetta grallaria]
AGRGGEGAHRRAAAHRSVLPAVLAARAPRKVLGCSSLNAGPSPAAKRGESGARPGLASLPPSLPARPAAGLTAALPAGVGRRAGGNPVCVRPVPAWQRGIGEFLQLPQKENRAPGGEVAGSSGL